MPAEPLSPYTVVFIKTITTAVVYASLWLLLRRMIDDWPSTPDKNGDPKPIPKQEQELKEVQKRTIERTVLTIVGGLLCGFIYVSFDKAQAEIKKQEKMKTTTTTLLREQTKKIEDIEQQQKEEGKIEEEMIQKNKIRDDDESDSFKRINDTTNRKNNNMNQPYMMNPSNNNTTNNQNSNQLPHDDDDDVQHLLHELHAKNPGRKFTIHKHTVVGSDITISEERDDTNNSSSVVSVAPKTSTTHHAHNNTHTHPHNQLHTTHPKQPVVHSRPIRAPKKQIHTIRPVRRS